MDSKPNILLIMADQLNASFLPMYGNSIVKAPHLAALAASGTTFLDSYCNFPICAPSRYSMLSGQLPHSIKAFDNASEFSASIPTVNHYLRQLGYDTILSGKMHFVGPDQLHGYEQRLVTDIYPSDFAWVPDWTEGPRNAPTGISMRAVIEAGQCLRSLQIDYDDETEYYTQQKLFDIARNPSRKPFFLTASFSHPHSPYTASKEHWERYNHNDIDPPKVGPIPLDEMDQHSKWLYYSHGRDRYVVEDWHVQNARHAYYGMISYVDDKVGRIIKILRDTGLYENTLIIFTSDHGEMLGERGMWYKQTFFEGAAKVPMIVSGAGWQHQGTVETTTSLVDLMPTILSVASNGSPPEFVRPLAGTDLARVTASPTSERFAISEYSDMGVCAPCRMIKSKNLKYIYTHGYPAQLFDHAYDPLELNNVAGKPEYAAMEAVLKTRLFSDWDPEQINQEVLQSQRDRKLIYSATRSSAVNTDWTWKVQPNDDRRYVRSGGDAEGTIATKGLARFPYVAPASPTKRTKEVIE